MLNLHRLFLLRELRRLETMSAIAREHSMSPSAISQQLSQLERESKVTLFEQAGRRVVLTDAGARLARRAEEMLGLMETAEAELVSAQGEAGGVLRVASFQTPLIALAPVAVSVLEQRHPDLRIEIAQREVEEAYEGLLAHRFEVILGEDYPGGQQVVRRGTDREDLLQEVWGWSFGDSSTVTVHVRRLREKVEDDPTRPGRLVTVWGVGYRWESDGA